MERKVLFGVFLLILPFGSFGAGLHELVKRGADDDHNWGYENNNGPESWPKRFKKCGGNRQSPIHINTSTVDLNDDLNEFEFDNFEDNFEDAEITNNGHTIKVQPNVNDAPRSFKEGGMDDEYQFQQLHFHWGSRDSQGSEHLFDKKAYPLEMHLVCRNKNYPTKEKAESREDGFAVLAVLFKVVDEDNEALEPIIEQLEHLKKKNSKEKVDPFNLKDLLPDETMPYYRYKGSLTTPPCLEVVTWTVFKDYAEISRRQLEQFRQITEDDKGEAAEPLIDNFRPPQPIDNRVVEISGNSGSTLIPSVLTAMFTALSFIL
ncbi:carbonic anhydrase 2-like [Parasteatoda tepidariorum]|uniref:carbonic anhydrase 2-like n=1 Tax=Parasteatoda tepidariorum TaxID=114398 RepID=UPI00077F951F|nr:carbonic anhydrase 2-like [Parasteatoda tepidariorum]